jgi:hypothetical protein
MNTEAESGIRHVVATRQKADRLFEFLDELDGGSIADLDAREVSGYGRVGFLGMAEQSFRITVTEGCDPEGLMAPSLIVDSTPDPVSGLQRICQLVFPCGLFMKVSVENLGSTSGIRFCAWGLPHGSGGP